MSVAQVRADCCNDFWPPFVRGRSDRFPARRKCEFPGRGHKGTVFWGSPVAAATTWRAAIWMSGGECAERVSMGSFCVRRANYSAHSERRPKFAGRRCLSLLNALYGRHPSTLAGRFQQRFLATLRACSLAVAQRRRAVGSRLVSVEGSAICAFVKVATT